MPPNSDLLLYPMISFQIRDHRSQLAQVQPLLEQINDKLLAIAGITYDHIRLGLTHGQTSTPFEDLLTLQKILQAKAYQSDCLDVSLTDIITLVKTYLNTYGPCVRDV